MNESSGVQRLLDARCNRLDHTPGRSIPGYIMAWANLYLWIYYGRGQFISPQAIINPGDKLALAALTPGIIRPGAYSDLLHRGQRGSWMPSNFFQTSSLQNIFYSSRKNF